HARCRPGPGRPPATGSPATTWSNCGRRAAARARRSPRSWTSRRSLAAGRCSWATTSPTNTGSRSSTRAAGSACWWAIARDRRPSTGCPASTRSTPGWGPAHERARRAAGLARPGRHRQWQLRRLIDREARVVWRIRPAIDGDPAFCALLSPRHHEGGDLAIELEDYSHSEQEYVTNTAILRTVLHDRNGGAVEVIDFAPRWKQNSRIFRPVSIIRRIRPLSGTPRLRVRCRPLADWGARVPESTWGSNHMRWILPGFTLRLTTDVPIRFVRDQLPFVLWETVHLVFGADETLERSVSGYVE